MRLPYPLGYLFLVALPFASHAQQPFEQRFGVKVKVLTLSNGRFPEFFAPDSLRRLGSALYDTRHQRIAALLPPDSLTGRLTPDVTSRWLSVDPLAAKYAHLSPYAYVANSPLTFKDPDGRKIVPAGKEAVAALKIFSDHANEKTKAMLKVMEDSEVIYYVNVGNRAETGVKIGGDTGYNFDELRVDIRVTADEGMTQAILGDELATGYQFETGQIGFFNSGTAEGPIGYDLEDELDTKYSAVAALRAVGDLGVLGLPKNNAKYSSAPLMLKLADNTATDADKVAFGESPGYKGTFTGSAVLGQRTTAEEGYAKMRKNGQLGAKDSFAYRTDGKLNLSPQDQPQQSQKTQKNK